MEDVEHSLFNELNTSASVVAFYSSSYCVHSVGDVQ